MPFDPSPPQIACADGAHNDASRYCGGDRAAVLIAPALGVPRRFYQPFAQFLAGEGYDVLSIDYRGIGESGRDCDAALIRLADWGCLDIDAALRWLRENSRAQRRGLVGHSLGGLVAARFVARKVMPVEYRRALQEMERLRMGIAAE